MTERAKTPAEFVDRFVVAQKAKATELRACGAADQAQAIERSAQDLASAFREWWLSDLTVIEAAEESGYSEERLRQLARNREIPHKKNGAKGSKGHLMIARCDLPRRPKAPPAEVSSLEDRLLRGAPARKAG